MGRYLGAENCFTSATILNPAFWVRSFQFLGPVFNRMDLPSPMRPMVLCQLIFICFRTMLQQLKSVIFCVVLRPIFFVAVIGSNGGSGSHWCSIGVRCSLQTGMTAWRCLAACPMKLHPRVLRQLQFLNA